MKYNQSFRATPDRVVGKNKPKAIILHHSVGSYKGGVEWLSKADENKVSYHCLIDVDGKRTVFASPYDICYHAGKSRMTIGNTIYAGCNLHSIGVAWTGNTHERLWTDAEMESAIEYVLEIFKETGILPVFTHAQVATPAGRKTDCDEKWYNEFIKRLESVLHEK